MSSLFDFTLSRRSFTVLAGMTAASALAGGLAGCVADAEAPATAVPEEPEEGATAEPAPEPEPVPAPDPEIEPTQEEGPVTNTACAVVYFSVTGNTEMVANKIAAALDVMPQALVPAEPYTSADIDYNSDCRANVEQQDDLSIRPALAEPLPDVAEATTVFLGYPIWWGKVPRVMLTYVGSGALSGKTVVPFCTSGSSGIEGSLASFRAFSRLEFYRFSEGA
ncbi:flavodoxin [Adlercreutzia equolifaciens]|uniref:flavodoxin n=1 Tax=Adlercreutzia equolifaciens TaxID=446660 RepID=UPI003A8372A7